MIGIHLESKLSKDMSIINIHLLKANYSCLA